jgi:hypothetical protein
MRRHSLDPEALQVESFGTAPGDADGCVCDYPALHLHGGRGLHHHAVKR